MNASIAVSASQNARSTQGLEKWLGINAEYARVWPNITVKREPPPDAKEWEDKPDKADLLSPNLGTGD
jgi:ferredoxin